MFSLGFYSIFFIKPSNSIFFFSSHYATMFTLNKIVPIQCRMHGIVQGVSASRSSWVQGPGSGRCGQAKRCCIFCSSSHIGKRCHHDGYSMFRWNNQLCTDCSSGHSQSKIAFISCCCCCLYARIFQTRIRVLKHIEPITYESRLVPVFSLQKLESSVVSGLFLLIPSLHPWVFTHV